MGLLRQAATAGAAGRGVAGGAAGTHQGEAAAANADAGGFAEQFFDFPCAAGGAGDRFAAANQLLEIMGTRRTTELKQRHREHL